MEKAPDAFRTISEVAEDLDVPQHVLRFWESRFSQLKPLKRGGGRRYYRPDDIDLLRGIRHLLYGEGYTIRGVQRLLKDNGPRFVQGVWKRDKKEQGAPAHIASPATASVVDEPLEDENEDEEEAADVSVAEATPIAPRLSRANPRPPAAVATPAAPIQAAMRVSEAPVPRAAAGLSLDDVRRLQAALYELGECRRLLDAALKGE